MTTIPNELKIKIRTSIPGSQEIKYNGGMTVKGVSKNSNVLFNPLMKLTQSLIDDVPEEIRKKQFFDRGLFTSLEYYHGVQKAPNLQQAKQKGYINNNIQVTLDTLFPANSVLNVNGVPYVIVDVQWTTGDWTVGLKSTPVQFDKYSVTNAQQLKEIINNEIAEGKKQLGQLPKSLVYGENYDGPVITSPTEQSNKIKEKNIEQSNNPASANALTISAITNAPIVPQIVNAPTPLRPAITNGISPIVPQITNGPIRLAIANGNGNEKRERNNDNILPNNPQQLNNLIQDVCIEEPPTTISLPNMQTLPKPELIYYKPNTSTITNLRTYFTNYYDMIKMIFYYLDDATRDQLRATLASTTTIQTQEGTKNPSLDSYNQLLYGMNVCKNPGKGDCFFIAVADAINLYNSNNQDKRIQFENYGVNTVFDIQILRMIVYKYMEEVFLKTNDISYLNSLHSRGELHAEELNIALFCEVLPNLLKVHENDDVMIQKIIKSQNIPNEYLNQPPFIEKLIEIFFDAINEVYSPNNEKVSFVGNPILHNDQFDGNKAKFKQFFVENSQLLLEIFNIVLKKFDPSTTNDNIITEVSDKKLLCFYPLVPEQSMNSSISPEIKQKLKMYVESQYYWADEIAISAVTFILGINVIPVSLINGKYTIQNWIYLTNTIVGPANKQVNLNDKWNFYLFLYLSGSHYELMTFKYSYYTCNTRQAKNIVRQEMSIFERNVALQDSNGNMIINPKKMPPLFMLFMIFGCNYLNIPDNQKNLFSFFPYIFSSIHSSFLQIIDEADVTKPSKEQAEATDFLNLFYRTFQSQGSNVNNLFQQLLRENKISDLVIRNKS